jgi:SAM-dependent methyltransferase
MMDPYETIGAFYDLEHDAFDDDIAFYLNHVVAGPVLEIGAGSGRITAALADHGHVVWAIDSSASMLARARTRLGARTNVHLLQARAEEPFSAEVPTHFRVAILSLNLLWHLPTWEDQLLALANVHRHLAPMGLLLVDSSNPITMVDRGANGELRQRFTAVHDGRQVVAVSAAWDDPALQTLSVHLTYDATDHMGTTVRTTSEMTLRYIYRFELELLLRLAGFIQEQVYGSYDLEQYGAESSNLIAVSRAQ